jgi:hypothetical protein
MGEKKHIAFAGVGGGDNTPCVELWESRGNTLNFLAEMNFIHRLIVSRALTDAALFARKRAIFFR